MRRFPRAAVFWLAALVLSGAALPASAFAPRLPEGAELSATEEEAAGAARIPVGPWSAGALPVEAPEGRIRRSAWRIPDNAAPVLALFAPLRAQIAAAGFDIRFECETDACGGFDFRYALDLLPEPEMHVDLGDFRYLAASRGAGTDAEYLALVVSRAPRTGFVHLTHAGPGGMPQGAGASDAAAPGVPQTAEASAKAAGALSAEALAAALAANGSAVLEGVSFATGAAALAPGSEDALAALAAVLAAEPAARVVLVGHTDAEGGLAANMALSQRRAAAVRDRLVAAHGVAAARLRAEGAGWLAPRASNLTPEGRMRNRRVEVMLDAP